MADFSDLMYENNVRKVHSFGSLQQKKISIFVLYIGKVFHKITVCS